MLRLTIIMACYGKNRWLAEAIESILHSGYHFRDTELLLCDDGSPAGGYGEVAESFAARYPSLIRVLHNESNRGGSYTHNRLLHEARGKYILVFDSDDIFVPFDIDANLDFLDQHPEYAATYGKKHIFSAAKGYCAEVHGGDHSAFAMLLDPRTVHNAMIFRAADVPPEWAYRLPSGRACLKIVDVPLWIGLSLRKKLYFSGEVRAFYRRHSAQLTFQSQEAFTQDYNLLREELFGCYPDLVKKAESRCNFQLRQSERLPFVMVIGGLFRCAKSFDEQYYWLSLAEQVLPDDYAIPDFRIRLLTEQERYQEAIEETFRLQAMNPASLYIRSIALRFALECIGKLKHDLTSWQKMYDETMARIFYLSPEQRKLLETAVKNAKALD